MKYIDIGENSMANPIDYKYVMMLNGTLEGFTVKTPNPLKINVRCPLCGDSQKSKSKKRGWFTEHKGGVRYGCFNCGRNMWLKDFLKETNPMLYDEYVIEGKLEWMASNGHITTEPIAKVEVVRVRDALKGAKKISQLSPDHPVKKYIENRKIPSSQHYRMYYTPKFNKYINSIIPNKLNEDNDEPRLILPFADKDNRVYGVSGRSFKKDGLRYMTIMFENDKPKVFGLDVVDFGKKNYVVEGPIDSLFLDNAWAMAGADVSFGNENTVYIYDNEPRNAEIVKRIEKSIAVGRKVVIWPEKMIQYGKDINDYIINGLTKSQIQSIIDSNTHSDLMARLKLAEWRKV